MITTTTKLRVRYGETDRMGYVYYGNYALYFEVARVEMLRELGVAYRKLEDAGILLPVTDYSVKYIKPAYYDEEITITCRISKMPTVRIHFDYDCHNADGELITQASTTLVFIDAKTNLPTRPSAEVLAVFAKYF